MSWWDALSLMPPYALLTVIARSEALILPGAKLNAPCATRRVNYKDVIYNLRKIAASLRLLAMTAVKRVGGINLRALI